MARRKRAVKRTILPDPKYHDVKVAKFVNNLMHGGKKAVAESMLYTAFDRIQEKTGNDPLDVFRKALDNVKPSVEVKSRRVGGSTYQVPVEIRPDRQQALANRWIIRFARNRSEKTMAERLAAELTAAANSEGSSVKKREDTHRMAEANKAFAHFRW
ncbi:30S ribosomal protein S7 [bacterium]|nr:30S ribosomal protein S7 [bacterium]MBU1650644.1 30S ribosomal protein S7 [bacterium]MBU1880981.1 30S ribosomal protein S7 [bacterium]